MKASRSSAAVDRPAAASPRGAIVIAGASSGGKSARAQSVLMPIPTTTRGSSRPEAVGLAEDAAELADRAAPARRPRSRGRWAT